MAQGDKEKVFFKICNAVLKLEVSKGHLGWKISDVSKEADVTRSLVYYYLGKEKEIILKEAWSHMLDLIFSLSQENPLGIRERMKELKNQINSMPYLFVLFFLEKNADSEIGELIRVGEKKLLERLYRMYSEVPKEEVFRFYLLELGALAYRNLTDEQADYYFPK